MAQQNLQVRSGNNIVLTLDGAQIGMIQNIRASDEYGHEPASGVGDAHVQEYVPGMARHTVSVSSMTVVAGSLRQLGIAAVNADDVLQGNVFDICVYDKVSGNLLRKYVGCTYVSGDVEISKHAMVVTNAQFMALDVTGASI